MYSHLLGHQFASSSLASLTSLYLALLPSRSLLAFYLPGYQIQGLFHDPVKISWGDVVTPGGRLPPSDHCFPCLRCPLGKYSKGCDPKSDSPGRCTGCPANTYPSVSRHIGGTLSAVQLVPTFGTCLKCPCGKYSMGDGAQCTACPIGQHAKAAVRQPSDAAAGRACNGCMHCPSGMTTPFVGVKSTHKDYCRMIATDRPTNSPTPIPTPSPTHQQVLCKVSPLPKYD
jgi:hypothetical protein